MEAETRSAIIGAGRVGSALARFFLRKGIRVDTVVSRSAESARALGALVDARLVSTSPRDIPTGLNLIVIAVPDAVIGRVAREVSLAGHPEGPRLVFHTSGAESSRLLDPLSGTGCATGSLHPIQSFPSREMDLAPLENIWCGIEGEAGFIAAASKFAMKLGWHPVEVKPEAKALYHAACVFAGNLITVIPVAARRTLTGAGLPPDSASAALRPMMETVLGRVTDTERVSDVLSGPFARGEAETVRKHLAALETLDPALAELFTALGRYVLTLLSRGTEGTETIDALLGDRGASGKPIATGPRRD